MEKVIGIIAASKLREKALAGDKEAAKGYLTYAVACRLQQEGYTAENAQEIAKTMLSQINVNVEAENG